MKTYLFDQETCGLHGVPVIMQYSVDGGPVQIVNLWKTRISDLLSLIGDMVENRVVAHNLTFDWFHVCKLYNMARLAPDHSLTLLDYPISEVVRWEYESQRGLCLKPRNAVCTLLLCQKGAAQSGMMDSKPFYVRRVPIALAQQVRDELERRTDLPDILFARRANKDAPRWVVVDHMEEGSEVASSQFADIKLDVRPSNGLKQVCEFILGFSPPQSFDSASEGMVFPNECGWAPFAELITSDEENWLYEGKPTWPALIHKHIHHWENNKNALEYAEHDITMLSMLYEHVGSPETDNDAILACQVAAVRLRGFEIDLERIKRERELSQAILDAAELNVNSPNQVRGYLSAALDEMEQVIVARSADKHVLKKVRATFTLDEEEECFCEEGESCLRCLGARVVGPGPMEVVRRADHIEEVRQHKKRIEVYDKLIQARRAYAGFKVIGAKSGRMAGDHQLSFHGIAKDQEVRELFTLADSQDGWKLAGGDYDSQELAILASTSGDQALIDDIKAGKSLHGLMASSMFEATYEDVMATKKTDPLERYDKGKSSVYLMAYGGTAKTMARNAGIAEDVAERGFNAFLGRYPGMANARRNVEEKFRALHRSQEGKGFELRIPEDPCVTTIFGFSRYFYNEYEILKSLFELANDSYSIWGHIDLNVIRSGDRVQRMSAAITSALLGAAMSVQNRVIRAALNHNIQSVGRDITMGLQLSIWELQPVGIHPFRLALMGIHDEELVTASPEVLEEVKEVVYNKLASQAESVPLIALSWATDCPNWFGVKAASEEYGDDIVHCGYQES